MPLFGLYRSFLSFYEVLYVFQFIMPIWGRFEGYNRYAITDTIQDMVLIIYIKTRYLLYWLFIILYMTLDFEIILYIVN